MRGLREGDRFAYVRSVDLAVALYTLGVPFFDPDKPYFYKEVKGNRSISFNFEEETKDGKFQLGQLVKAWPEAHMWSPTDGEPSPMTICKRTIWERRFLIREVNHPSLPKPATPQLSGHLTTTDLRFAAIACALGFEKAAPVAVEYRGDQKMRIANKAPEWLHAFGVRSLTDLQTKTERELEFIHEEGNEWNPIAISMACYLNVTEWLDHFRTKDKPHYRFEMPSGLCFWVKKGTPRWDELTKAGYKPE